MAPSGDVGTYGVMCSVANECGQRRSKRLPAATGDTYERTGHSRVRSVVAEWQSAQVVAHFATFGYLWMKGNSLQKIREYKSLTANGIPKNLHNAYAAWRSVFWPMEQSLGDSLEGES